jgi:hypothetical protein
VREAIERVLEIVSSTVVLNGPVPEQDETN